MTILFGDRYKDKRVLITGHTGFKGSWLSLWLTYLGAKTTGFSSYVPSVPCNFQALELEEKISDITGDIRDIVELKKIFDSFQPDIVFHLAAQPIVRTSYDDPKLTFDTNLGGTVNVLECIRTSSSVKAAVFITSDKCYQNVEWIWGYRENDRLGGDDPYSASKACAENAIHAYSQSFFKNPKLSRTISLASARAGNVIGGGDWAKDRIIPDCVRAWENKNELIVRNLSATRPWQHVLEPLSGYLCLGSDLLRSSKLNGESFNFGPDQRVEKTVQELLVEFSSYWEHGAWRHEPMDTDKKESTLLKLSCDKALHLLDWHALLSFEDTVRLTGEWYNHFYSQLGDMYDFSIGQIEYFVSQGLAQNVSWAEES
jgi:CDP-glucose 4,6-dehydratase